MPTTLKTHTHSSFSAMTWLRTEGWFFQLYLIGINSVVFGVEVCASASFTYIPPLMLKMGFSGTTMGIVVGIGPLASLFLVPVIGRCSDKMTKNIWPFSNRREPFIVALSVILIFSLIVIPYCREVAEKSGFSTLVIVAGGVILLDLTTQSLLNPCKALVSDILLELKQTEKGFTVFSFMLNSGSAFGYLLTSVNWANTRLGNLIGSQEKLVFVMMAVLYSIFLLLTLTTAYFKTFVTLSSKDDAAECDNLLISVKDIIDSPGDVIRQVEYDLKPTNNEIITNGTRKTSWLTLNHVKSDTVVVSKKTKTLHVTPRTYSNCFVCKGFSGLTRYLCSFVRLPSYVIRLFVADLFCWMALHAHDIFFTDYVGKVMYHGNPNENEISRRLLYDEGVRTGSFALLLQCAFAAVYSALLQDRMLRKFGEKKVFLFGMGTFTLCMMGTLFCTSSAFLEGVFPMEMMAFISGLGVASVNTIPNNVITRYHEEFFQEVDYVSETSSKSRGIGEDMAVLDAASFVSQVIPAIFLGYLVDYYQSPALYVVFAATTAALATLASRYIFYNDRKTSQVI